MNEPCGARRLVGFYKDTNILTIYYIGTHTCTPKLLKDIENNYIRERLDGNPHSGSRQIQHKKDEGKGDWGRYCWKT